ncbi:MAG: hypothetical protein ACRCW2_03930 [Cellulosilyticaceae bacterium]
MIHTPLKTLLTSQTAPIISPQSTDQALLFGSQVTANSPYYDALELQIITADERSYTFPLDYGGYNASLFLADFTGQGTSDLLITSYSGGSGSYAHVSLYHFNNGGLDELFSSEGFDALFSYTAHYLPYYQAQITSHGADMRFNLTLTHLSSEALSLIYSPSGQVITNEEPMISALNAAFPIKLPDKISYDLLIWQRIIGPTNADTLGMIQTLMHFPQSSPQLVNQTLVTQGLPINTTRTATTLTSELFSLLPKGSRPLPLSNSCDQEYMIFEDLNHDGLSEILLSFSLEDTPALAVFSDHHNQVKLLDTYFGKGRGIHDLTVLPLKKDKKGILIGWQQDHLSSILNILELKGHKLVPLIQNNLPAYSFFDLIDFNNDGQMEIILWMHDTNEAYKVQVYEALQTKLLPTNAYNKIYFQKVVDYYTELLKLDHDNGPYLYYLTLAQAQLGLYPDARATLDYALSLTTPYPSIGSLKKLRNNLKTKERMH